MFDINVSYNLDLRALNDFVEQLQKRTGKGSATIDSFRAVGQTIVATWIRNANAAFKHSQGQYVQGILDGIEYPYNNDALHLYIENRTKHAYWLEVGYEPFDMKKMLETSQKVRVSTDGYRFLVIPFQHGTPGTVGFRSTLSKDVYKEAKTLKASFMTGTRKEGVQQRYTKLENPIPEDKGLIYSIKATEQKYHNPNKVTRNNYHWGESVDSGTEKIYRFENNVNLVRKEIQQHTPLGKFSFSKMANITDNNRQYSSFMSFRVMSERSGGWMNPGMQAKYILKNTVQQTENQVVQQLNDGIATDLKNLGFNL